nr:hypothetical protein [Tanacetum cinerariifolium]
DDDEQEIAKIDEQDDTERGGDDDEESESDDEEDGNGEEDQGLRISEEKRLNKEEEAEKLYRDVNINQGRGIQATLYVEDSHVTLTPVHPDGQQESSSVSLHFVTSMLNPPSDAEMELKKILIEKMEGNKSRSDEQRNIYKALVDAYAADKTILDSYEETVILKRRRDDDDDQEEEPSAGSDRGSKRQREGKEPESASAPLETTTRSAGRSTTGFKSRQVLASESAFAEEPVQTTLFCFEDRVKSLEVNFSEFMRTNQSPEAVSNIPAIVHQYMHQEMTEAVREAVQTQTDQLQDSIQRENDEFLRTINDNMKKIIKEQVKSQVKLQVTRILPRIEESVNAQLEAEVLTRSSHSSRTSYVVAADLLEMELKKILIDKMEGNKSIQRSDEQRNLYIALVEAYDADKTILDSYGESAILKRIREEDDDQEGPSARSDRGSKRRREGGEHASASTPSEPATGSAGRRPPTPDRDWNKTFLTTQGNAQSWISALAKQTDARSSFNELLDTPIDFSNFIMNRLGIDTLTPELLAGLTYELMRGSCNSLTEIEYHLEEVYKATIDQLDWDNPEGQQYPHNLLQPLPLIPNNRGCRVIPFEHFINNNLEYLRGGASSRKYTTSVTKSKAADYRHIKWIEDLVPRTMWIQEPLNYNKHALWGVYHWGQKPACGRSSTGSRKLPKEAQPYKARHVSIRFKATRSVYCLFEPKRIYLSKQGQEKQYEGGRLSNAAKDHMIYRMLLLSLQ